jgi:hypothetical protein
MAARLFYRPPRDFADPESLVPPCSGERIVGAVEISQLVAKDYNLAVSAESTQSERRDAFTAALRKLIDDGVLIPRAHYGNQWLCLVTPVQRVVTV